MRSRPARSWWIAARGEAGGAGEREHRVALALADLDHEAAVRREPRGRLAHDVLDRVETGRPGDRARRRAPTGDLVGKHVGRRRRTAGSTRSGRARPAARRAARRTTPLARAARPPRSPEAGEVGPRHGERVGRHVGGPDVGATERQLGSERQRDRARPGAEVGDHDPASVGQQRAGGAERMLDHVLGLGPRDQHPPVDQQVELAEPPRSEHVLQRLARPRGERPSPRSAPSRPSSSAAVEVTARRLLGDPARLAPRQQPRRRVDDQVEPRRAGQPAVPASCRARSSATSASTTLVELAGQHLVELVEREPDAVVGDPVLLEVVGADLLGAPAAADLARAARRTARRPAGPARASAAAPAAPASPWPGSGSGSSRPASATTRPVGLWVMRTAESVVFTDWPPGPTSGRRRSARSLGSICDVDLLGLGQHRDGGRRGVDAALALGDRHPLHPVRAALVLHAASTRRRPSAGT